MRVHTHAHPVLGEFQGSTSPLWAPLPFTFILYRANGSHHMSLLVLALLDVLI